MKILAFFLFLFSLSKIATLLTLQDDSTKNILSTLYTDISSNYNTALSLIIVDAIIGLICGAYLFFVG